MYKVGVFLNIHAFLQVFQMMHTCKSSLATGLVFIIYNCPWLKLSCRDGAVVRALASHQCGPGLIPGLGVICGLSLLLVLVPAPRVFLRVLRFSSLHKNQHFEIPIRPGNSGWKSHSVDSTESPFYLFIYLLF